MQLSWPKSLYNKTGFEHKSLAYETDQKEVYNDVRVNHAIELEHILVKLFKKMVVLFIEPFLVVVHVPISAAYYSTDQEVSWLHQYPRLGNHLGNGISFSRLAQPKVLSNNSVPSWRVWFNPTAYGQVDFKRTASPQ